MSFRRVALPAVVALAAVAVIACNDGPKKSGPAVAKGKGVVITADEFKARLDEQNPFLRARFTSLDRKKEFLDTVIRFEVLAQEAEKQGLGKDPAIQLEMKKRMVQLLVQKAFPEPTTPIADAELKAYYDEHLSDYVKPKKLRAAALFLDAAPGTPARAAKAAAAKKALDRIKAEEKRNNPSGFGAAVAELSDDAATKGKGGDLDFRTQEELAKAYTPELADAVFKLEPNQTSGVVETPRGFAIVRVIAQQPAVNRPFEAAKAQIQSRLNRERKTKQFDEWLKKLIADADVKVDEKALEAVEVAAAPAGGPGMPGGHGGMAPAHGAMPSATPSGGHP